MKRMIALLLGMLFVFPAVSLGEDETRTVEFEDFTLVVEANDLLLTGDEAGSANIFKVFPNDDENAATHPNIIARWTEQVIGDLSDEEVAEFCNGDMQAGIESLTAQKMAVSNEQMLRGERDEETGAITVLFSFDVDAAALGLDMKATVYMGCRYVPFAEKGTYYFTIGCSTQEEAEALFSYLDTHLIIKE